MWKKPNAAEVPMEPPPVASLPRSTAAPAPTRTLARIGPTLAFKGNLEGDEDLVIEGRVEGKIAMKQGSVTVGEKGRVEADIDAASIEVAGVVKGNLTGADRVVLRETGRVEGNIASRSVSLENGCHFKGSIDMQSEPASRPSIKNLPAAAPLAPPRAGV